MKQTTLTPRSSCHWKTEVKEPKNVWKLKYHSTYLSFSEWQRTKDGGVKKDSQDSFRRENEALSYPVYSLNATKHKFK